MAMLENVSASNPDISLYTDASGSVGCGACWDSQWFQLQWPKGLEEWSMARKESLPIVIACMVWGSSGGNKGCGSIATMQQWHGGGNKSGLLKGT